MNTKINDQLKSQEGKIATVGRLETDVSSFRPSSESIIRFTLTKGKSLKRRSLNLRTVAIYLLSYIIQLFVSTNHVAPPSFLNSRLIIYFGVSHSHRSSTPFPFENKFRNF